MGELVKFGILVLIVVVIALVARRGQPLHPPPAAGPGAVKDDPSSDRKHPDGDQPVRNERGKRSNTPGKERRRRRR